MMAANVFNIQSHFLYIINKLEEITAEYQKLNPLLITLIGKYQEQDYKTFERNNKSIALNVLHIQSDGKLSHLYKSEFNKTRVKQVMLLLILLLFCLC